MPDLLPHMWAVAPVSKIIDSELGRFVGMTTGVDDGAMAMNALS